MTDGEYRREEAVGSGFMDQEGPAYELINGTGAAPVLLLVEHAGPDTPGHLNGLGVCEADRQRHIWYDIGIAGIAKALSARWNAPCLMSRYSRLVVDLNREPDMASCIPVSSDGTRVPGNEGLSAAEREQRIERYFWPYHRKAEELVAAMRAKHGARLSVLSLHSMTHRMGGIARPWQVSVLWEWDDRIARPLLRSLRSDPGLSVGENVPYSGRDAAGTSCRWYGARYGLPHVLIEFRQDLIALEEEQKHWAGIFAGHFEKIHSLKLEIDTVDTQTKTEIEAAAFRRLVAHLRERTDVQNIDLMNLSGFCRNCLSKWTAAEAKERGLEMDDAAAREFIYGMPYGEWKDRYQTEATPAQLAVMKQQQEKTKA